MLAEEDYVSFSVRKRPYAKHTATERTSFSKQQQQQKQVKPKQKKQNFQCAETLNYLDA